MLPPQVYQDVTSEDCKRELFGKLAASRSILGERRKKGSVNTSNASFSKINLLVGMRMIERYQDVFLLPDAGLCGKACCSYLIHFGE